MEDPRATVAVFHRQQFLSIDTKISRLIDQVDELKGRVLALERDYRGLVEDRLRQEISLAQLRDDLERVRRRLELTDEAK